MYADKIRRYYTPKLPPSIIEETTVGTVTTTYLCYADPISTSDSLEECVIMRVEKDSAIGVTTIQWAEGELIFNKSWTLRASYNYYNLKK